jgi:tetratricopeptide (TPR) repeat protein
MTFDVTAHYRQAVAANIRLWRHRIMVEAQPIDRWRGQHEAVWGAVVAGLALEAVQAEAAAFAVALLPTLERWGMWQAWLPLLETARALTLPPDLQIRLLLTQGRIYVLNRNFNDAVDLLEVALSLAQQQQLLSLVALAHYRLTNAYLGSKAYAQARAHGASALHLLPHMPLTTQAALYNSLGLIELETAAFAASEEWFQQALALWQQTDEPTQLARTCLNLGIAYQQQGRWGEAKASYERARGALVPTASVVDKLKVLNGLGTLHYLAEELPAAEAAFRQGVVLAQQLQGIYHLRGSLTHNLGNTLLAQGRLVEARMYLEKSVVLWQQADDDLERANSLGTLGELFAAQAMWRTAVSNYQEALELLAPYRDHPWAQKLVTQFQAALARCVVQDETRSNSG